MRDIVIIGGGLAGLANAILLKKAGLDVLVIERKSYPFHKVCGEYISNESLPFLRSLGVDPMSKGAAPIHKFLITSHAGSCMSTSLGMGGFGLSRYVLDEELYKIANSHGVEFRLNTQVTDVKRSNSYYRIFLSVGHCIESKLVIGSFGKRSNLDRQLDRPFFYKRSPYVGVKYHMRSDLPQDQISLHIFPGGYCGVVKIEEDKYCLCYLSERENLKKYGNVRDMEENVLWKNPTLESIFRESEFLFDTPETINEISFEKKSCTTEGILMTGDAAGMITPLCGNGMSMALQSAKSLSSIIIRHHRKEEDVHKAIERAYSREWDKLFTTRLERGRILQRLLLNEMFSDISINILSKSQPLTQWVIGQTHGKVF